MNEKRHPSNANIRMNSMFEACDKDSKAVIIKILQQTVKNSLAANKEMENLHEEIKATERLKGLIQ